MFGIRKGAEYLITVTDTMPKDTVGHSVYVVCRADTLSYIAGRNGMKLQELLSKNPHIKNPGKIYPGMEINLD